MSTSLHQQENISCLQCAQLQRVIAQQKQQIETLQKRVRQYQARFQWEDKLFSTPSEHLSDAEKILARCLPDVVRNARKRETTDTARDDGLTRVYVDEVVKKTGKNERRVGPTLQKMADKGYIKREFKHGYNADEKKPDNALYLDTTPELMKAEFQAPDGKENNRGHNQKHFMCRGCGSQNTKVRRLYEVVCRDCGEIHHYDANNPQDRAFIVDDETAATWEETYITPDIEGDAPPMFLAPARPCFQCGQEDWVWNPSINNYRCGNDECPSLLAS